jgi:colanic acid/amylovoran biosynthesis glycosyltransferase
VRVALFAHHFLEPTHHAMAAVIMGLEGCEFWAFGKSLTDQQYFRLDNVVKRTFYRKGSLPRFADAGFQLAHIIYDGNIAFEAAALATQAHLPFVLSFHGGFDTKSKIHNLDYRSRTQSIAQQAAAVTVVSDSDARRLKDIGVTRGVDIVPVPIDFARLPRIEKPQENRLISIGRIVEKKGIDISIRALALLPPDYTLMIVGNGILEESLREFAACFRVAYRISWMGLLSLKDTLDVLSKSGVLLHPARTASDGNSEGTPQAILWSQAIGVPVISTYSGDIPEIITHRDTGLLIETDNPKALAEAVTQLGSSRQLRTTIIARAHSTTMEKHDIERIPAKWRQIYQRVALKQT